MVEKSLIDDKSKPELPSNEKSPSKKQAMLHKYL